MRLVLLFANWHGWGKAGSWRRRLIPFAMSILGGFLLAITTHNAALWVFYLTGFGILFIVVFFGCLITFGPFIKDNG